MRPDKDGIITTPNGDRWVVVGYSAPRQGRSGSTYRLVRERDGARKRVDSNKIFWLEVSRKTVADLDKVSEGHDDAASGGGAAKLKDDQMAAKNLFKLSGGSKMESEEKKEKVVVEEELEEEAETAEEESFRLLDEMVERKVAGAKASDLVEEFLQNNEETEDEDKQED